MLPRQISATTTPILNQHTTSTPPRRWAVSLEVKKGFLIIKLSKLSFNEQIELFNKAKIIIGSHGAGLTNIIFSEPSTQIIEIGNPNVDGAVVEAKLLDNVKDRTVLIFHKRRRKHSRKMNGHRQRHSKIQIIKILSKGGKIIAEAKPIELKVKTLIKDKKETKKASKKD